MLNQDIETGAKPPERPKDAWFDHWMCAKGEPLVRLVGEPLSYFVSRERRVRKRTREAQARFDQAVEALVCNLAYAVLKPTDTGAITVPLSKRALRSRYDNPAVTPETMKSWSTPWVPTISSRRQREPSRASAPSSPRIGSRAAWPTEALPSQTLADTSQKNW